MSNQPYTVHFARKLVNGRTATGSYIIRATPTSNTSTLISRILDAFHRADISIYSFAETLAFEVTKIEGAAGAFTAVTDLSATTPERNYRVNLNAIVNGRERPQPITVKATSGADAKAKVWNSMKDGGLGSRFCSEAAGLESLTITVEVEDSGVIFEASPSADPKADLSATARTFGNIRASVDNGTAGSATAGRIVNMDTGEVTNLNPREAWAGYRSRSGMGFNVSQAYNFITDYVPAS